MAKTPAEQIEELMRLRDKGAISDEEYNQAKARLLSGIGTPSKSQVSVSETVSSAADSVASVFSNSMSDSAGSFKNLAWILYWGTAAANVIGLFPPFVWVSTLVLIAIAIVAMLKTAPSVDTIYNSHFRNIVVVSVVSFVGVFFLILITVGTLGLGIIVTGPLLIALLIWYVYRVVKGMMRLNEGKPY